MKKWIAPERNWEGIQFEALRRKVDPKFNELHDVLSKAFYEGKEFVWKSHNWGILSKAQFDKLHGLVFLLRTVKFHQANMLQPVKDKIPESEYNLIRDDEDKVTGRHSAEAAKIIAKLKDEHIELEV